MAKYTHLFIVFIFFHLAEFICGSTNVRNRRSLHFARHLREELSSTSSVTVDLKNELNGDNIPAFLRDSSLLKSRTKRYRRQASTPQAHQPNNTVFQFNDSHTKMVVHWAGKNSQVIISLTKGLDLGNMSVHSSHVYVSHDYGENFTSINNKLKLANGSYALIENYYSSPVHNSHYIFADETNNYTFVTQNYGTSVTPVQVEFRPKKIVYHPKIADYVLGMDDTDGRPGILWLTTDFGRTWEVIARDVKIFYWEDEKYISQNYTTGSASHCIYIFRISHGNTGNIIRSCNFFRDSDYIALLRDVQDFEIQHQYMFATKEARLLGGTGINHQIWVSHYRGPFYNAEFPHDLTHLDYYVADTSEDQVMLCVNHEGSSSHLYISDVNGTRFTVALEDILYFNPNTTSGPGTSYLRYREEEPFADLHKVEGMRGVYIASQLINKSLAVDHQRTLISFDKGGEWQLVEAPRRDILGRPTNCSIQRNHYSTSAQVQQCSLHLGQEYDRVMSTARPHSILSRKSAPGFIMATGNTGSKVHVDSSAGIYLSTDSGWSWRHVLEGTHIFVMVDHGGLLVAVIGYVPTNEIIYSTDDGETWKTYKFVDDPIRIHGVLTEPGEATTVLFLFGSNTAHHSWKVISLNMSSVFKYNCEERDYKHWSMPDDTDFRGCLLGRKTIYERRIARTNCYNGRNYEREISVSNCSCTREDFECAFGFNSSQLFGQSRCLRMKDVDDSEVYLVPNPCPIGSLYPHTRGYKKIVGDTCVGGAEHRYGPLMYACRVSDDLDEFVLFARREKIIRHIFGENSMDEVLIHDWEADSISAVDFDYINNCLYWADNDLHKIRRLCEDGMHGIEDLHNSSLGRVTSLAFDWKGDNIYWFDDQFKVLEVSKKNGRFRRELLRGQRYFDKPSSLVLDPYHGWMYWIDQSQSNPRIMKAWMDASNTSIKTVFNRSIDIQSPRGLTIDYEAQVLYWTDDALRRISTIDLHTGNRTVLVRQNMNVQEPGAIGLSKTSMYWIDSYRGAVMSADKYTGSNIIAIDTEMFDLVDLKVMEKYSQRGGNQACDEHQCSQLCLLIPPVSGNPHDNNRTCRCSQNTTRALSTEAGDEVCCPSGHMNANGTCVKIRGNSTCTTEQFTCPNGRCIPLHWKCDRDDDCGDRSDEMDCPYTTCLPSQFRCKNGGCILATWKCDHDDDCHDGSDEENFCVYPPCEPEQFRCNNSRCINKLWICDGDNDCRDDSDELNCTSMITTERPCEATFFHCANENGGCIPSFMVCNNHSDCADGSDERNCTGCPSNEFTCNNGHCTYQSWVCDGYDDCGDHSDEDGCTTTTPHTVTTTRYHPYSCNSNQFTCNNGLCVSKYDRCDNVDDCGDFSDEINCRNATCSLSYEYRCASGQCIYHWQHCNGNYDCNDHSDERYCSTSQPPVVCNQQQFLCWNNTVPYCIEMSSRCDGFPDCNNMEDEQGCGGGMSCDPRVMFKCRSSQGCLPRKLVCSGVKDCADGSDEWGCHADNHTGTHNYTACSKDYMYHCEDEAKCVPYMFTCDGNSDCSHGSDESLSQCFDVGYSPNPNAIIATTIGVTNLTINWMPDTHANAHYIFSHLCYIHGAYQGGNMSVPDKTNATIKNLHPAHAYYIDVYVNISSGILRPFRKIKVTTLDDYPDQPTDVDPDYKADTDTVEVTWYSPRIYKGRILKYRIYACLNKNVNKTGENSLYYQDVKGLMYSATLNSEELGLSFIPGQKYLIWITAFTTRGEGARSDQAPFIFGHQCQLPYVGNLNATFKGNNSIELSWKPSSDGVESYKIVYTDMWEVKHTVETKDVSGETIHFTVPKLCSGSYYGFGVIPQKKDCHGQSLWISSKTNGSQMGSLNVTVDMIGPTTVNISWPKPIGASSKESYIVFYDYRLEDLHSTALEERAYNITTSKTYVVIDKLRGCEFYYFRVAAIGEGKCPLSHAISQWTAEDPRAPPEDIEVIPLNRTAVNITWHPSCVWGLEPLGYIINKLEVNRNPPLSVPIEPYTKTNKTEMFFTYYNLFPGATYEFTLMTAAKGAKISEPIRITLDSYDAPTDVMSYTTSVNFDSGRLSWKGNLKQVPKKKFKGYEILSCSRKPEEDESVCSKPEAFKFFNITTKDYLVYSGLPAGKVYIFAVRLNKIEGYYGKMTTFSEFEVLGEGEENTPAAVTLSKTNVIAIGVSITAVVIALGVILAFFIVRHKRLQRSFRAFANSHYDSRSGTTTFTAADELDEDLDQPMIRGFSDDEPLVIA